MLLFVYSEHQLTLSVRCQKCQMMDSDWVVFFHIIPGCVCVPQIDFRLVNGRVFDVWSVVREPKWVEQHTENAESKLSCCVTLVCVFYGDNYFSACANRSKLMVFHYIFRLLLWCFFGRGIFAIETLSTKDQFHIDSDMHVGELVAKGSWFQAISRPLISVPISAHTMVSWLMCQWQIRNVKWIKIFQLEIPTTNNNNVNMHQQRASVKRETIHEFGNIKIYGRKIV